MRRLMILGGTREARLLAQRVASLENVSTVFSLAGRTEEPIDPGVPCRIGGFGGVLGLENYLKAESIDMMVDATHPYASQMSANAHQAALEAQVPTLHLDRAMWQPEGRENWLRVPDFAAAVAALPTGAIAFTATGRSSLDLFSARPDIYTCLRVLEETSMDFPGNGEFVVARPPFSVEAEIDVLRHHRATHLVVKNAGGVAARTKLTAAAKLGLPIIVVDRTPLPQGCKVVQCVDDAYDWILGQL